MKDFIYKSPIIGSLIERAEMAAASDAPAFITGENGTGKEYFAQFLHTKGGRASEPFIAVNCAALPHQLIESELFGSRRGSYTGSTETKDGLFKAAGKGTIFLDELAEMPIEFQSKLLRVLQDKEVRAVGDSKFTPIGCRVVAATNRPIQESILNHKLREDLYFRLAVITLHIPALRERIEDIEELFVYFVNKFSAQENKKVTYGPELIEYLKTLNWSGNVRQLENSVHRAVIFSRGMLSQFDFNQEMDLSKKQNNINNVQPKIEESLPEITTIEKMEERHILNVMNALRGKKKTVAKALGLARGTLDLKLKKYNLDNQR
jgi:transcriptional regulator with PAS, ATPase and Fis domain